MKVDRVTLQRELARARKTLSQAERDLEGYRHHLQNVQEQTKKKHSDQHFRQELDSLRREAASKQQEVEELKKRLQSAVDKGELEKLAEKLRAKDVLLVRCDDENIQLKVQAREDAEEIADLKEELEAGRERIRALEDDENDAGYREVQLKNHEEELQRTCQTLETVQKDLQLAKKEIDEAKQDAQKAIEAKTMVEHDLNEVSSASNTRHRETHR